MTYDIDTQKGRHGFSRWRIVEFKDAQGRFLTRAEASARVGDLNDEYAGIVRDRISPRWWNVTKRQWR